MENKFMRCLSAIVAFGISASFLLAQTGSENRPSSAHKKHILFLGGSKYYAHDAVSNAMYAMGKLGEQSGLFDVMFRTDFRLVTKQTFKDYLNAKNLNYFDAVMLFTQGEFPLTAEQKADFLSFVRDDGKGLLVAHSGTDFNHWEFTPDGKMSIKDNGGWPELIDMIGGVFVGHPFRQNFRINVEDRTFPATRHFPKTIDIAEDETYEMGPEFSRDKVHVLMSMDIKSVDLQHPRTGVVQRKDHDFPMAWEKTYDAGRVFVSPLGHIPELWDRKDIQQMWLEATKWVLKLSAGDTTSRAAGSSK
jgi:type 1 glutamine amidotransferase